MTAGTTGAKTSYGKTQLASGNINFLSDTMKLTIGRLSALSHATAITNATNAGPIVITATSHGLTTGDRVQVTQVGGNTNANGSWTVTVTDANTFSLDGSEGNASYTSGGYVINLEAIENYDDIDAGAKVAEATLSGKTVVDGKMDAATPVTFSSVAAGAPCDIVFLWKDSGSPGTSPVLGIHTEGTDFPLTPNGNNVNLALNNWLHEA